MNEMTTSDFNAYKSSSHMGTTLRKVLCLCCFMLCFWGFAHAETAIYQFQTTEQEKLFYELTAELRCPQCQNNNIAESNAGLSSDMRAKVYELVSEGQSKKEIVQYMVDRYGNFITYDPPVTSTTLILWIAPLITLLIGLFYVIYRSRRVPVTTPAPEEIETKKVNVKQVTKKTTQQGKSKQTAPSYIFMGGAALFLVINTAVIFYYTINWEQKAFEEKAVAAVPEMKERYLKGEIDNVMQVQLLAAGLRSQLLQHPDNADDWRLLGELYDDYMMKPDDALRALENAFQYKPDDYRIKSFYAQLLLRTSPSGVNREKAVELLNSVLSQKPDDLSTLYWLALHAQSEQQYMKSIALWERLLSHLSPASVDAKRIREHLEKDKQAYEQQLRPIQQ